MTATIAGCQTANGPEDALPELEETTKTDEVPASSIEAIDEEMTEEELTQGWYYGELTEKKSGTPDEWVWINGSEDPKWIEPVTEMMDF